MARPPTTEEIRAFPRMTRWFDPILLSKLLLNVIVSKVFSQYADRRLIMAALDTVPEAELLERCKIDPDAPAPPGETWIDYIADLGDGFDATYAMAYLLAQDSVSVGGVALPRGEALVMGGDEVYPTSSGPAYKSRLISPYGLAMPPVEGRRDLPVFMIPGNHDWYDGLMMFLALFCRGRPVRTKYVQWRTPQRRSYFALQLTDKWWLWAVDIALTTDVDQPQADYFTAIARNMPPGSHIIICSAEPGWYKADVPGARTYRCLSYVASLAKSYGRNLDIPLALSGDTHHYARYDAVDRPAKFITSGGGGAFLHGTNHMKETIRADTRWLREDLTLSLKSRYPSSDESNRLLCGNFKFPLLNTGFAAALGIVYWLAALPMQWWPVDGHGWAFVAMLLGFGGYTAYQEHGGGRFWKNWVSIPHVAAHWAVAAGLGCLFARFNAQLPAMFQWGEIPFWLFAVEMTVVGGAVAGFIFGVFLYLTCRFCGMNHNDAFSAMRLDSHRHFLRLHIKGDEVTVYPIALDRVPRRDEWERNPDAGDNLPAPKLRPKTALRPRLIEEPIIIRANL